MTHVFAKRSQIITDIVAGHTEQYIRRHYRMTAKNYQSFLKMFGDRIYHEKIKKKCSEFNDL